MSVCILSINTMTKRTALFDARRAKGLSQEQLGKLVGLSQAGVSRLEKGEYVPMADVARKLIEVLGVSLDEVIGEQASDTDGQRESAHGAA
jgi:transcriptional regulator with XRE-family HTH domain